MAESPASGLLRLAQCAGAYAKCYAQVVEALMREGVVEAVAREEARSVATAVMLEDYLMEGEGGMTCPYCGSDL